MEGSFDDARRLWDHTRPLWLNLSRAGSNTGDVGAAAVGLAAGDDDVGPGPARARAAAAGNDDVVAAGGDGARAGNVLDLEVGDGDAGRRGAVEVAAVVVLLDDDAVLGDGAQRDARVRHARDGARVARGRLDADACRGIRVSTVHLGICVCVCQKSYR